MAYPAGLDDLNFFFRAPNRASSTLSASITAGSTTINLVSGSAFSTGRQVVTIGDELIVISSRTADALTVETRGFGGTVALSHNAADPVRAQFTGQHHEGLSAAIIALQTELFLYRKEVIQSFHLTNTDAPGAPTSGDRYITGPDSATPADAWDNQNQVIAEWNGTAWVFTTPVTGMMIYVSLITGATDIGWYRYDGATWTSDILDANIGIKNIVEDITPQLGAMLDRNGQDIGDGTLELLKFVEIPAAVNEPTITNAATGGAPKLSATGDDTNIDFDFEAKGTGATRSLSSHEFQEDAHFDEEVDNGNSGSAKTLDFTAGNMQKCAMTDDCTFTFTDPGGPCVINLKLTQDVTGTRIPTWPANVKWPAQTVQPLSTAANARDRVVLIYDGTDYDAQTVLDFG